MNNSKYLIGYLNDVIRPLVLILPKTSGYVKTFKDKVGDKDKNNDKLMPFRRDDDKLLEKYKTISFKIEDLHSIELNALPVYDDKYIKTKRRTYDDKVYTDFRGLHVPKDGVECEYFTTISMDSLLVYEDHLQAYLDNFAYKIVNT